MVHHQQEKPVLVSTNDPNNYKSSSTHRMASTSSDHGYFCAGFITSSVDVSLSNLVVPLPPVSNNSNSQHHQLHQSSGFHTTTTTNNSTDSMIYNLATGFEMIGFHTTTPPSDSYPHNSTSSGSSSYPMLESTTWQRNINTSSSSSLVPPAFRDSPSSSSSRSSQRYHHPALTNNKGLSLSLNSISSTTTNSFDHIIRHHHSLNNNQLPSPTPDSHEHGAGFSWKNTTTTHHHQASDQQFDILKASNYLISTQELLNEFCSLETKHQLSQDVNDPRKHKKMSNNKNGNDDEIAAAATTTNKITSSSDDQHHLCALGIVELQKRKKRLVFMLDELDRRYKHYNTQMKSIVSTFESVVGEGAASVYTSLASRAMSRHFRSLRDGIINQIKVHNKVINGGCDNNTTKDRDHQLLTETTPRLRILDQALRQEKALQQMSLMESHPWRPQRGLPERSVSVLRAWLFEHFLHPYPSDVDKHILARQTGLSRSQVSNWFINARVRLWKPMVEEMYVEEIKDELQDNSNQNQPSSSISSAAATATTRMVQPIHNHQYGSEPPNNLNNPHHYNSSMHLHKPSETKPTQDQLLRIIDPENESLSSIVNHSTSHFDRLLHTNRSNYTHHPHEGFTSSTTAFGTAGHVSMDHQPGLLPYDIDHHLDLVQTNYVGLRGAEPPPPPPIEVTGGAHHVSLTLGLHQNSCGIVKNGRENVSLQQTFPNGQGSFFYTRDDHSHHHRRIEDHQEENSSQQVHQYNSLLRHDDDAGQQSNLPYRNLLGAQLLNDFGS